MSAVPNDTPLADSAALLEASGLVKHFGPVVALRSADLRVRGGEIHALMGANGAGKSTLVKILTGALTADAGTITLGGRTRSFRSTSEARRAGLICVYQDPSLLPDLTVLQTLMLTATPITAFRRYLIELGLGGFDLQTMPRELARPTLSLLDLARALAIEPRLLLLDEITASLPADLTVRVFNVARQLRAEGRSVIFISHRLAEVSALCDRATVLRDGKTVGVVEPAQGGEERIVKLMIGPAADLVAAEAASPTTPATGAVAVAVRLVSRFSRWGPINPRREKRQVEKAVKRLQIDTRVQSEVRRLSRGNQQKVGIARWLVGGFQTLLCFDPTRGIDIGTKRQIYGLVKELAANGSAVLLFTSELPEIQLACNRVIVLFGGKLVDEMPASEADEKALLRAAHGLPSEAEESQSQEGA